MTVAAWVRRSRAEQATARHASTTAVSRIITTPLTTSVADTPPTRKGTLSRGRLATHQEGGERQRRQQLAQHDRPRPQQVTWRETSVCRSRSPEMADAVSPGTMKHTSMSMKNSSQWKIERPTDADASGLPKSDPDDCDAPR